MKNGQTLLLRFVGDHARGDLGLTRRDRFVSRIVPNEFCTLPMKGIHKKPKRMQQDSGCGSLTSEYRLGRRMSYGVRYRAARGGAGRSGGPASSDRPGSRTVAARSNRNATNTAFHYQKKKEV